MRGQLPLETRLPALGGRLPPPPPPWQAQEGGGVGRAGLEQACDSSSRPGEGAPERQVEAPKRPRGRRAPNEVSVSPRGTAWAPAGTAVRGGARRSRAEKPGPTAVREGAHSRANPRPPSQHRHPLDGHGVQEHPNCLSPLRCTSGAPHVLNNSQSLQNSSNNIKTAVVLLMLKVAATHTHRCFSS